jgi:hypothetical protein
MPEISPSSLTAQNPQLTLAARNITASALTGWTNYGRRGVNETSATIDSHSGTVRVVEIQDRYAAAPPPSRTGRNQAQEAAA